MLQNILSLVPLKEQYVNELKRADAGILDAIMEIIFQLKVNNKEPALKMQLDIIEQIFPEVLAETRVQKELGFEMKDVKYDSNLQRQQMKVIIEMEKGEELLAISQYRYMGNVQPLKIHPINKK